MKKIMYFAAALLVLAGCSNKEEVNGTQNAPANYGTITGKIELPQGEDAKAGARMITAPNGWKAMEEAFKMQWESADKIYIYNQTECKELAVKSIDAQTGNATFEGELLSDMSDYKVACGYNPMAGATAFAVDYIADNYRPFADGTGEYNIFTIDNFGPVMGLKLQGKAKVGKIEVVASKSGATQATYTMTLGTAIELNTGTVAKVYFPLNDLGDADKLEAKFYMSGSALKTQAFVTLPAKNMVTTYPAIDGIKFTPTYVDLGLSVKWATCNVGAFTPEGYGDYFAWGETSPKDKYSWANYKWCISDYDQLTKYCSRKIFGDDEYKDYLTVLELADDAAYVNWGGNWRMPKWTECVELSNNCDWIWTTDYNNTGVKGYLVKSRTNSNSIFLPAAGCYENKPWDSKFVTGYYWSSQIEDVNCPYCAWLIFFNSSGKLPNSTLYYNRFFGLPVRAVCQ